MSTVIDTLITDRAQSDVDRVTALIEKGCSSWTAAELAEWNAGMKGAYNASDLNRVGQAVAYLAQAATALIADVAAYLAAAGVASDAIFKPYDSVTVTAKQDWTVSDVPSPAQMQAYLADILELRGLLTMPDGTPAVPDSMNSLTVDRANNIEKILIAVDRVRQDWWALTQLRIDYIGGYKNQLVSGTCFSGDSRTVQHFSRGR